MERYSNSTREVAQDGRRGALMLSVSIKHPDSEAFIDAKMTEGKITGANVSVKIDDDFMHAAIEDKEYVQQFPIDSDEPMTQKASAQSSYGRKSYITHGKAPNRACCSGTPSYAKASQTVMPTLASALFQQTRAAKFRFVLTTHAACFR